MTRLKGHTLYGEGAPYPGKVAADAKVGRVSTAGTGVAYCSCMAISNETSTAAARKAWHRDHKTAVKNLADRRDAIGAPAATVNITLYLLAPVAGWVLEFTNFEEDIEPMVSCRKFKGESARELVFQAVEALLGVEAIKGKPLQLRLDGVLLRHLLAASLHLLPETWTVASQAVSVASRDASKKLFQVSRETMPVEKHEFRRSIDPHGQRTVLVAADASVYGLGSTIDGVEENRASAGWVIFDLEKKKAMTGNQRLDDGPVRVERRELQAIECALKALAAHPSSRDLKGIGKIAVACDSAAAVRLLNRKPAPDPIVRRIHALTRKLTIPVEFTWVKGHDVHPGNIAADGLARHAQTTWATEQAANEAMDLIQGRLQQGLAAAAQSARDKKIREMDQARRRRKAEAEAAAAAPPTPVAPGTAAAAARFLAERARQRTRELHDATN